MSHLAPWAAVCIVAAAFLAPAAAAERPLTGVRLAKAAAPAARVSLVSAAASGGVTIRDFSFGPATLNVKAGDTVTWRNRGKTDHTATGKSFDTGVLSPGAGGSFTFHRAGTFAYVCSIHPNMKGTVKVARRSVSGRARLPKTGRNELGVAGIGALLLALGAAGRLGLARRRVAR
jgi:plastocyanin